MAAALPTTERFAISDKIVIGRVPGALTSTVAVGHLSVSRPPLMTWVRDGGIESFQAGTHTRFRRDEVLRVRADRGMTGPGTGTGARPPTMH